MQIHNSFSLAYYNLTDLHNNIDNEQSATTPSLMWLYFLLPILSVYIVLVRDFLQGPLLPKVFGFHNQRKGI